MEKGKKIALGIAAFWPLLYLLGMLSATAIMQAMGDSLPGDVAFVVGKILLGVTGLVLLAQLVGYSIYLFKIEKISKLGRFQYLALLLLGHIFTLPLLWRTLIWRGKFF